MIRLFILLFIFSSAALAKCPPAQHDATSRVTKITDGDTLTLSDGSRVRFIGINTPEIGRRGNKSQLFAQAAADELQRLVNSSNNKIILQYGQQRNDHYKRLLAHVFLSDGTNVSEALLLKGLAYRVAVPPNLWAQDCYQIAENTARQLKIGLWSRPALPAQQLAPQTKGFYYIEGAIRRVGHSKKSVWLNFDGPLSIRIARTDLPGFQSIDFDQLLRKQIRVRGWVHHYKGENIMRLRHSSMLEIMK